MKETKTCHICGSDNVTYNENRDELICRDCGNIQTETLEE